MGRDQSHYIQNNRADHTPLYLARDKGYIPPSFLHHFGIRWRSIHSRPPDTCAQNIMHASSLHHKDCKNTFSSFSNLNLDSIYLVSWRDFFPCGFFSSSLYWAVTLLTWCNGWPMVLVTRAHRLSKLAFRGGVRILILPCPIWSYV